MQRTINLIGEDMNSGYPIIRNQEYKTNQCPKEFYEWSELKSSYLVKNIIKDDNYNRVLVNRMTKHAKYLCRICNINFDDAIREYLTRINTNGSKDVINPYPVGQMHMFKGESPEKLLNNFYALYNFNKFIFTYSVGYDVLVYHSNIKKELSVDLIVFRYYYNFIQQKMFRIQQTIRGNRKDVGYLPVDESDILGISNNRYTNDEDDKGVYIGEDGLGSTVLNVKEFPSKDVKKWQHPGINSCRPYFNGKYGQKIKEYVENPKSINNFFSSLQCGISASTNYVVFPLLFTIGKPPPDYNETREIIEDIITMAVLGLCGDGGHNLREVLSAIISTFEMCKIMSEKFLQELGSLKPKSTGNLIEKVATTFSMDHNQFHNGIMTSNNYSSSIYKHIHNELNKIKYTNPDIIIIFKEFTTKFYYLGSFCDIGAKITRNVNITGITTNDLITSYRMNVDVIQDKFVEQEINNLSSWLYDNVIMKPYDKVQDFYNVNNMNIIQILLSLLNDRYKKDNFNKGITGFYNSILSRRYPQIIENINQELDVILEDCEHVITQEQDIGLMENIEARYKVEPRHIPYA